VQRPGIDGARAIVPTVHRRDLRNVSVTGTHRVDYSRARSLEYNAVEKLTGNAKGRRAIKRSTAF
jgi:hypothetical protein